MRPLALSRACRYLSGSAGLGRAIAALGLALSLPVAAQAGGLAPLDGGTFEITPAQIAPLGDEDGADEGRRTLGVGRLFTNDYIGDGHDRWRTGSYTVSLIRGSDWQGALPTRFGEVIEYRFGSEIIAPMRVWSETADRPYVGRLSLGAHGHMALGPLALSAGVDLVALGPQTGMAEGQIRFHETFGFDPPRGTEFQVEDSVHLAGRLEAAWPLALTETVQIRPYAEVQKGIEEIARLGADLILGPVGQGDLLVRDEVTGHLIRAVRGDATGFGLILGADVATVGESVYLPASFGAHAAPRDERRRLRAGLHWQAGPEISLFYGATWLSEEFASQPEGQVLGSLTINLGF